MAELFTNARLGTCEPTVRAYNLLAGDAAMKNPYEMLRQKESELVRVQREVEALRIAIKLLAEEVDLKASQKTGELTQAQMIRIVLQDADGPLHVNDIATMIEEKFGKKFKAPYVTSTIYRYMRNKKLFRKEKKPNTFGLLEWPAFADTLQVNGVHKQRQMGPPTPSPLPEAFRR
jgi:hypothetical protein